MAIATPFNRPTAGQNDQALEAARGLEVLADMFAYYQPEPMPVAVHEAQPEYDLVA